MRKITFIGGILSAMLVGPAFAAPVDNFSSTTRIASMEEAARVSPRDGGAEAELAAAYVQAGRIADAVRAYHRVLKLDNVMLETRNGSAIWSHEVAHRALTDTAVMTSL